MGAAARPSRCLHRRDARPGLRIVFPHDGDVFVRNKAADSLQRREQQIALRGDAIRLGTMAGRRGSDRRRIESATAFGRCNSARGHRGDRRRDQNGLRFTSFGRVPQAQARIYLCQERAFALRRPSKRDDKSERRNTSAMRRSQRLLRSAQGATAKRTFRKTRRRDSTPAAKPVAVARIGVGNSSLG